MKHSLIVCVLAAAALQATAQDNGCRAKRGTCQLTSEVCRGRYENSLCGGAINNRCCVPFPNNDNLCREKSGICKQRSQGCEDGRFWFGQCSGGLSRQCCVPKEEGCDPNNMDFRNVPAMEDFEEEKLLGTWYLLRWYLPLNSNATMEPWNRQDTFFKRSSEPNRLYFRSAWRDKDKEECNPEIEDYMTKLRDGVYQTENSVALGGRVRSTFMYVDDLVALEILCYGPNENGCRDYAVQMWSRCKWPRIQDLAKGVVALQGICYPELAYYIDVAQFQDCAPPAPRPNICDCVFGKDYLANQTEGKGKSKGKGCKQEEEELEWERDCSNPRRSIANVVPAYDITSKKFLGRWYLAAWYIPETQDVRSELQDFVADFYLKKEYPNMLFWDGYFRLKYNLFCEEPMHGNSTMTRLGQFYTEYLLGQFVDTTGTIIYIDDKVMVEITCAGRTDDDCKIIGARLFSREKVPKEADIVRATYVLFKSCYPFMTNFLPQYIYLDCAPPEKEMPCDEMEMKGKEKRKGKACKRKEKGKMRDRGMYDEEDDDYMREKRKGKSCKDRGMRRRYEEEEDDMRGKGCRDNNMQRRGRREWMGWNEDGDEMDEDGGYWGDGKEEY